METKQVQVLLVEDCQFATQKTRMMLNEVKSDKFDVELTCADQLSKGLEFLAKDNVDIVLLDLMLPDSYGLHTVNKVLTQAPEVPIVVLSGLEDETIATETVQHGAQDYLIKDQLNGNLLKRSILYAIERNRFEKALRKHREHLEELVEERTRKLEKINEKLRKEITERKQAEKALRIADNNFRNLINKNNDGMVVIDQQGIILFANPAAQVLWERKEEELMGQMFGFLLEEGETTELEIVRRNGPPAIVEMSVAKVDWGKKVSYVASLRDITDRKQAENDLRKAYNKLEKQTLLLAQSERMSAIGTLVAGVAHELNNPMMSILHFIDYCLKHTTEVDRRRPILKDIKEETERCVEIVQNLLTFSHMEKEGEEEFKELDCSAVIDRVLKLLTYRVEKNDVIVKKPSAEEMPTIRMKENKIQQVFLNLFNNALDAMMDCENKEIRIEIHNIGEFYEITFADTGCGIPRKDIQRIFDPFYTTKPVGKGTGLGLSICQSIVEDHGGMISCESEPGKGTQFKISMPKDKIIQKEDRKWVNISW